MAMVAGSNEPPERAEEEEESSEDFLASVVNATPDTQKAPPLESKRRLSLKAKDGPSLVVIEEAEPTSSADGTMPDKADGYQTDPVASSSSIGLAHYTTPKLIPGDAEDSGDDDQYDMEVYAEQLVAAAATAPGVREPSLDPDPVGDESEQEELIEDFLDIEDLRARLLSTPDREFTSPRHTKEIPLRFIASPLGKVREEPHEEEPVQMAKTVVASCTCGRRNKSRSQKLKRRSKQGKKVTGVQKCALCDIASAAVSSAGVDLDKLRAEVEYPHEFYDRYSRSFVEHSQSRQKEVISICQSVNVAKRPERRGSAKSVTVPETPCPTARSTKGGGAEEFFITAKKQNEERVSPAKPSHLECQSRNKVVVITDRRDSKVLQQLKGLKGWLLKKDNARKNLSRNAEKRTNETRYQINSLGMAYSIPDYNNALKERKVKQIPAPIIHRATASTQPPVLKFSHGKAGAEFSPRTVPVTSRIKDPGDHRKSTTSSYRMFDAGTPLSVSLPPINNVDVPYLYSGLEMEFMTYSSGVF